MLGITNNTVHYVRNFNRCFTFLDNQGTAVEVKFENMMRVSDCSNFSLDGCKNDQILEAFEFFYKTFELPLGSSTSSIVIRRDIVRLKR